MKMSKSTRHAKITGDFGETLILYWLSKYGFECACVDHTGIDIIARNPKTKEVMGVSVKSRCRDVGTEDEYLSIPNTNFDKAKAACESFNCVPYFAIVVDTGDTIYGFILPMSHLLELFPLGKTALSWKMTEQYIKKYEMDQNIKMFVYETGKINWW